MKKNRETVSGTEGILTLTVYLLDMVEYDRFNTIYRRCFETDPPARTCNPCSAAAVRCPGGIYRGGVPVK